MAACQDTLKKAQPTSADIATLAASPLDGGVLEFSYQFVRTQYQSLGATDQAAKGPGLLAGIKALMNAKYPSAGAR